MGRLKATWCPTRAECAKMLSAAGFEITRYSGSHAIWKHADGRTIPVPITHPSRKVTPVVWRNVKRVLGMESNTPERS